MIGRRDLTPLGRTVAGLFAVGAVLTVVVLIAGVWDRLTGWLPWSDESRLARAESRLEQARTDLAQREADITTLKHQAEQTDDAQQTLIQAHTITVRATTLAEGAPDANDPIDPARADRLRDADRRLCGLVPDLCAGPDDPAARTRP